MRARGPSDHLPEPLAAEGATDGALSGGVHLGPGDLAPDEERLLAALERDSAALQVDPVEDFLALLRDGRSPTRPEAVVLAADDGLTPLFTSPEDA